MRTLFSVCGCADPVVELVTNRPVAKSARKSPGAKIQSTNPDIVKKLEELRQVKESKPATNAALQHKYDELERSLNKCKDELKDLQSNSGTAAPQHLRSKYVSLGAELKKCKDELQTLHEEAKVVETTESLQKDCEALVKYRKEIEDELQKCWAQLKLFHLENQFASASSDKSQSATNSKVESDAGVGKVNGQGPGKKTQEEASTWNAANGESSAKSQVQQKTDLGTNKEWLVVETTESLQKDCEALVKYRKEIEDELQKCYLC